MRDDTTCSCIEDDGYKVWVNSNNEKHRVDGPAIIFDDGVEHWYLNGERHRDGGPASTYKGPVTPKQQEQWFQHGLLHREDGPASTYPDGIEEWYINGKKINYEFTSLQDLIDNHPEELI